MRKMYSENQILKLVADAIAEKGIDGDLKLNNGDLILDHTKKIISGDNFIEMEQAGDDRIGITGNVDFKGAVEVEGAVELGSTLEVAGNAKLFEKIVDSQGNKRFIEGDLTIANITGLTDTYAKWSLSGTHLMIVLAGDVANETAFTSNQTIATLENLPTWIKNKIIPVWDNNYVVPTSIVFRGDDWSTQNLTTALVKISNNIEIRSAGSVILNANRHFRIQYDLLIDNEQSE